MDYAKKNTDIGLVLPDSTGSTSQPTSPNNHYINNKPNYRPNETVCNKFIPIENPYDSCYLDSTTKIDIDGIPEFDSVNSITDGTQTLSFSSSVEKRQVPGSWFTWSEPPYSESATPPVLFAQVEELTISLSTPSKVFGIELEPNSFGEHTIVIEFYSGLELLGTISKSIEGNAGARLLAAAQSCTPFDTIIIKTPEDADGFAMAQFRYGDGIDCNLYCTDRCIEFECKIETEADIIKMRKPRLVDYNLDVLCEIGQCYAKPRLKVCHEKLYCDLPCVPVDIAYIKGVAELILSVEALVCLPDLEPEVVTFTCVSQVDICQTCFDCAGQGICGTGELKLTCIEAYINRNYEIVIKGTLKYICPEIL